MALYGLKKITPEEFIARRDDAVNGRAAAIESLRESVGDTQALARYLSADAIYRVFAEIVARWERVHENRPDVTFHALVKESVEPKVLVNPLSRSTSTLSNLDDDMVAAVRAEIAERLAEIEEYGF